MTHAILVGARRASPVQRGNVLTAQLEIRQFVALERSTSRLTALNLTVALPPAGRGVPRPYGMNHLARVDWVASARDPEPKLER